jgi:hypothetical protein
LERWYLRTKDDEGCVVKSHRPALEDTHQMKKLLKLSPDGNRPIKVSHREMDLDYHFSNANAQKPGSLNSSHFKIRTLLTFVSPSGLSNN